ncbi:MAG: hypothetical protein M3Q68_02790, partial [Actinomycetota bacterium]|nr:hypothetical protein [Actinomycetota bacterium]
WEPHVLVAPGAALLVLAFDVVAGRAWSLPLVAVASTIIAQAWATMLPFAVAMGLWAAAGAAVRAWRDAGFRRTLRWSLLASVGVLGILWAPPIVEQLRHEPGNLRAMATTLNEPGTKLGLADAWRAVAGELGHRATWLGFEQPLDGPSTRVDLGAAPAVPIGALLLVVVTAVALVRRQWTLALLGLTSTVAAASAVVALSRLIGPVFLWIPQWLRLIGLGAALTVGAAVSSALPRVVARRLLVPAAAAVLAAATVVSVIEIVGDWREDDPLRDAVLALASPGARSVPGTEPVLVRSRVDANLAFGGDDVAIEILVLGLERQGVSTVVDAVDANRFGPQRAHADRARRELRLVAAGADLPAGFTSVATVDPLGAAGRQARRRVLVDAGLPGDATDREFLQAVAGDRTLLRFADRLQAHPDLPALELLRGESSVTARRDGE